MADYIDKSYLKELAETNPAQLTTDSRCRYNKSEKTYSMIVWGEEYHISQNSGKIQTTNQQLELRHDYFDLFIIYYLLRGKKKQIAKEWISEKDLAGGATFFRGPHLLPTSLVVDAVGDDLQIFNTRCRALNGQALELADSAFRFEITPEIPIAILYWQGDEDFGAEAKLLFDRSIEQLLPLDIIFAIASYVCFRLNKR